MHQKRAMWVGVANKRPPIGALWQLPLKTPRNGHVAGRRQPGTHLFFDWDDTMQRQTEIERITNETSISAQLNIDGRGSSDVHTGIPFLDHMLTLFSVHGFFDLSLHAKGDLEVDNHHTVEDVGIVLGDALDEALGDRRGVRRYGHAVTPMDETLSEVSIDLSKRPFLIVNLPAYPRGHSDFDQQLLKEFLRAFVNHGGVTLHVNVPYGENEHHIIEAVFKGIGRALDQACAVDPRIRNVRSSKGKL